MLSKRSKPLKLLWFRLLLHDFILSSSTPPSCSLLPQTRSVMGPYGMQFPSSQLQFLLNTMWWSQLTCPPQSLFWPGNAREMCYRNMKRVKERCRKREWPLCSRPTNCLDSEMMWKTILDHQRKPVSFHMGVLTFRLEVWMAQKHVEVTFLPIIKRNWSLFSTIKIKSLTSN